MEVSMHEPDDLSCTKWEFLWIPWIPCLSVIRNECSWFTSNIIFLIFLVFRHDMIHDVLKWALSISDLINRQYNSELVRKRYIQYVKGIARACGNAEVLMLWSLVGLASGIGGWESRAPHVMLHEISDIAPLSSEVFLCRVITRRFWWLWLNILHTYIQSTITI